MSAPTSPAAPTASAQRCCFGPSRSTSGIDRRALAGAARCPTARWAAGRATCAPRWESPWTDNGIDLFDARPRSRLELGAAERGWRAAPASASARPPTARGGSGSPVPEVSSYRRSPGPRTGDSHWCGKIGDMSDILDELSWRGLIAQSTDLDALARTLAAGPAHPLFGIRPDRAQPACRPPGAAADAAPVPAGRTQADRAGRRRHRHDRRSPRRRRAHAEHGRHRRRVGRTGSAVSSSASSIRRLRHRRAWSRTT